MKKRVLSLVLTVAMIATLIPVAAFAADDTTTFPDMPNDWSTEALQNAIDNGLLNGIDGKIAASENLTRAQMAAIVTRAFGTNGSASLASFGDVNSGDWYYDAMAASVKMGAFKGDGNKLNPNVAITRQEAFTVLARLFTLTGADQSVLNGYTDGAKVADWAKDSMASMVKAGYVSGSDNMLNPTSNITRAEFAKVMDNLLKDYLAAGATEGKVTGNAILNKAGTLENVTVSGDLIVGDGAAEGDVTLKNVTVNGRLVVRGGGVNTVKLEGTTKVGSVVINKATGDVRLNNTTSTAVNVVVVSASATLTGKYDVVTLNTADTMLTAADATIATVNMNNEDTGLQLTGKSTVTTVNVNEDAKGAAVNVAKDSTIATVNSKADGVKMAGEGKITKANVSGNNNAVNTVGTTLVVSSGVTGTTSNGNDIKGGTTVTTAATGSKPTTGGSTDSDWGWGDSTTTVEVDSDSTLATAINEGKANIINVKAGTDLSAATVSATRTSSTSLTINFGDVKIANLSIEALNVTNITLNGDSAETQITGTLTINAPKAHVVNNVKTGTADIKAASKNSYVANKAHTSIKLSGGARVVLADAAKAATISVETVEPVILAGTMDGKITVSTANADATIAGTAKEVEVTGTGANLTVAKGAETAGNVTVKSAANVTVESGAKAAAVEVTSEGASASVTVAGEATKVTVGAEAKVSLESGAKVPEVAVTASDAQVSIDTNNATKVDVAASVTGVVVEATAEAKEVTVAAGAGASVTVNAADTEKITTTGDGTVTKKASVKVTFDANGGEVTPAYMMIEKHVVASEGIEAVTGGTIATLPTATRLGYVDSNTWNTQADGKGTVLETTTTFTADVTYYAQWGEPIEYTVTYEAGMEGVTAPDATTYNVTNGLAKLADAPEAVAGYAFDGWYNGDEKVTSIAAGTTGAITLTAKWTAIEYTITYVLNDGTNPKDAPTSFTVESEAITLPTPEKDGAIFLGWYEKADFSGEAVATIPAKTTGNKTYFANWKEAKPSAVDAIEDMKSTLAGAPAAAGVQYTLNANTKTFKAAAAEIPYTANFYGYWSGKQDQPVPQDNGWFIAIKIPVSDTLHDAIVQLDSPVFWLSSSTGGNAEGYKVLNGNDQNLFGGQAGGWYIEVVRGFAKADGITANAPGTFTFKIDYDGNGVEYTTTTYTVDLSALNLATVAKATDEATLEAFLNTGFKNIEVTENVTLDTDVTIAEGQTVVVAEGKTLTVNANKTLTVNGTLSGAIENKGTVVGYYNIANGTTITTSAGGSLSWLSGEATQGVNTLLVGASDSNANLELTSGTFVYAKAANKVTYTLKGEATVQQAANGATDATEPFVVGANETFIVDTGAKLVVAAATDSDLENIKPVLSVHATGGMLTVKGTLELTDGARVVLGNGADSISIDTNAVLTDNTGEYNGEAAATVDGILNAQHVRVTITHTNPTVE